MVRFVMLVPLLIAVIVGGFFLWGLDPDRDPSSIPSVLIAQPAPEFALEPVDGVAVPGFSRADLIGNSGAVVVNVFASWCVPCRAEHAVLTSFVERDGIRLFCINYKDKPKDAAAWLKKMGNPYELIGSDISGRAGIEWGISGVPETFIINKHGIIVHKAIGPRDWATDDAMAAFAQLVEQS